MERLQKINKWRFFSGAATMGELMRGGLDFFALARLRDGPNYAWLEAGYLMRLTSLHDLEVGSRETLDRHAVLVQDDHIDPHQLDAGGKMGVCCASLAISRKVARATPAIPTLGHGRLGAISRMIGIPLDGVTPGDYELVLKVRDDLLGRSQELVEALQIR